MLEKSNFVEISNVGGVRVISLNKNYDSADGVQEITQQIESLIIPLDKQESISSIKKRKQNYT